VADSNLPTMHRRVAQRLGPRPALRFKRHGLYHDLSWDDYRRQADAAAAALIVLGIEPGDRVGLLSENRTEWLIADIALLSAGAADVPMHAPLAPRQVAYQLGHAGARAVLVSDQAQADKVLAGLDALPDLDLLVSFDPVDARGRIRQITWEGLIHRGRQLGRAGIDGVLQREGAPTRDDLATIIYTSGTTGQPKGVMLSHGNLLSNVEAMLQTSEVTLHDVLLSWLPYSHIYARTVDHYLTIRAGVTVCLAESLDTLAVNLAETQPTRFTAVPRFYEKVWAAVEHLEPAARRRHLHELFGPRVEQLSSGGAPLPRHICAGFFEAGLPLLEGYGLTESSPVICFNRPGRYKVGTVGAAVPGVEVRIAADGEILTRGPHVMLGYWKDPEATRAAIVDGWLHTGDVGRLDADGFLTITDRKKDLIVTSGGKNIAPGELERLLAGDPYIDQAVVCGDGRPFVAALIVPNFPRLHAKAQELGCPVDVVDGLVQGEAIHAFLADRIGTAMQDVSGPERVKAFLLLGRPFQVDAEELTATLKLRRRRIIENWADHLDRLYAEATPPRPKAGGT
jgi:long-chain acyl-CoA synthetase